MSTPDWFTRLVADIRSLKIQGAERVARAGIKGLARLARERTTLDVRKEAELLTEVRPTEPMLRNAISYFLRNATPATGEKMLARIVTGFDEADTRIAEYAASLVKEGGVYFTHCHSTTVVGAFLLAHRQGKVFAVHNTETRPREQGRKTARELAKAGIPVTHFVDSGALIALKGCAAVFLGADALLADGRIANKIGSEMIAELAKSRGVPVYVLANSWKYDPATAAGYKERLEERSAAEVWKGAPKGVDVKNYAFDLVDPGYITAVITELGIRDPFTAIKEIRMRRTWLFPTEYTN